MTKRVTIFAQYHIIYDHVQGDLSRHLSGRDTGVPFNTSSENSLSADITKTEAKENGSEMKCPFEVTRVCERVKIRYHRTAQVRSR